MSEIVKLAKFYNKFHFCGQLSDVLYIDSKFDEILKHLHDNNIEAVVHNVLSSDHI